MNTVAVPLRKSALPRKPWKGAPIGVAAAGSLAIATYLGLVRIGWSWPQPAESVVSLHGALMVCGFLGTVISVERAVAFGKVWGWFAPAATALGGITLLTPGMPRFLAPLLFSIGSLVLFAETAVIARRQFASFTLALAAASALWLAGNVLWTAGLPIYRIVPWWMGFLVLSIASERLELGRVLQPPPWSLALFAAASLALVSGLVLATSHYVPGLRVTGGALLAIALWLLRFDIARRTVFMRGLTRFMGAALLAGFLWLAASGLLLAFLAGRFDALARDAAYHSVFIGFVLGMIFAHAPVILPAVAGFQVRWTPWFYAPLALLHASLAARIGADLAGSFELRPWTALGNAAAVVLYAIVLVSSALRARRRPLIA